MRRLTWLLLLLLAAVALLANSWPFDSAPAGSEHPAVHGRMPAAPTPVAATGELARVVEEARPAVLRIESRCSHRLLNASPIDVGTGFFISPDGDVLTAYHVVRRQALGRGAGCQVQHYGVDSEGREYALSLVGFDAIQDVALLEANVDAPVPHLQLATEAPRPGSEIVAIGNSRGEFLADRAGEVTRLGVEAGQAEFASGTIELTAAVAPGDSGGPVVDANGRVTGVVSYISFQPAMLTAEGDSPLAAFLGLRESSAYASYAVPVLEGSALLDALLAGEMRDVPVIGFEVAFEYDPRDRDAPSLGSRAGVVVGRVDPGGPGASAGLRSLQEKAIRDEEGRLLRVEVEADVIVAVDGQPTTSFQRLLELVRGYEVGESVNLSVQRGSEQLQVELQLAGYRQVFRQ